MTRFLATAALALFLAATPVAAAVPANGTPVEPPIEGLAEAHAAVLASGAPFAGFTFLDSGLIGASAWWSAYEVEGGWSVVYTLGWGDCPAGCISNHDFVYLVDTLVSRSRPAWTPRSRRSSPGPRCRPTSRPTATSHWPPCSSPPVLPCRSGTRSAVSGRGKTPIDDTALYEHPAGLVVPPGGVRYHTSQPIYVAEVPCPTPQPQ
jgi:hypothetical protein